MNHRLVDSILFLLAIVVFVANTDGLVATLGGTEASTYLFAALIALAAGSVVFVFWHSAFAIIPDLQQPILRVGAWATVCLGALCIVLISAWWSIAALGGKQAQNEQYNELVLQAEQRLTEAASSAKAFQALIPRIEALGAELQAEGECEKSNGCVTGGGGDGGVEAYLHTMAGSVRELAKSAKSSVDSLEGAESAAADCLSNLRAAVANSESGESQKAQELASALDCVNASLADISNVQGAQQIQMALASLTDGLVVPVSVKKPSQIEAVSRIVAGIKVKSASMAKDAGGLVSAANIEPITFHRLNPLVAVLTYAHKIIPAVATAVSLDLAPILLLMLKSILAASYRRGHKPPVKDWSVQDVLSAVRLVDDFQCEDKKPRKRRSRDGGVDDGAK